MNRARCHLISCRVGRAVDSRLLRAASWLFDGLGWRSSGPRLAWSFLGFPRTQGSGCLLDVHFAGRLDF